MAACAAHDGSSSKESGGKEEHQQATLAVPATPSNDRSAGLLAKVLMEVRSGLISSVIAEAALFPLDLVKLRLQIHGGSILSVFREVLREHGVRGLYNGLGGRLIQTITSNVGFFIWQTIAVQMALRHVVKPTPDAAKKPQLSTGISLVVNMLAQQVNRVLTTPVDVVANVNQADPKSKGFFSTFVMLARTGGRAALWRGLPVSLLLSLNPALMFTCVGKLSAFCSTLRGTDGPLTPGDMFWISAMSKAIATLLTYPLIRAKATQQTFKANQGLLKTLTNIVKLEGAAGLYSGMWIMSYKTVLFNSMMMALKQKFAILEARWRAKKVIAPPGESWIQEGGWREKVSRGKKDVMPWAAATSGEAVVYVDGSWSFLHEAQAHMLSQAARRGDHVVVGVHSDECHQQAVGSWPGECYAARVARLRVHPCVHSILEEAPWAVEEDLLRQLGISKVLAGSFTKREDCAGPTPSGGSVAPTSCNGAGDVETSKHQPPDTMPPDPYELPKRLGCFEEVPSLNTYTEHDAWVKATMRVLFSNVDASIDWRILVSDHKQSTWGVNPGYSEAPAGGDRGHDSPSKPRASST